MKIRVQPIHGAYPLMCSQNVKLRIKALGGTAVYGWRVYDTPAYPVILHQSHVVWCSPDGELIDVTPDVKGIKGEQIECEFAKEIEFIRDDEAKFDQQALPCRYIPRKDNPHLHRACELMVKSDICMKALDHNGTRYWTDKANRELRKSGCITGFTVPDTLTPQSSAEWSNFFGIPA